MTALITDPHLEAALKIRRHAWGADRFDEVWEGVYIMSPQPNVEHQELVSDLGVRELLVTDRYPWSLEIFRHNGSELVLAARSTVEKSEVIASAVVPLNTGRPTRAQSLAAKATGELRSLFR